LIKERQGKGIVDQEISEFKRKNQLFQAELDDKVIDISTIETIIDNIFIRKKPF